MSATTESRTTTSVVVLTRLQPRGVRGLRGVLRQTGQVVQDCQAVDGFLGGRLAVDARGRAWTLTVWASPAALREFGRRHAPVAAGLDAVATASASTAFRQDGAAVPSWADAAARTGFGRPRLPLSRPLQPAG